MRHHAGNDEHRAPLTRLLSGRANRGARHAKHRSPQWGRGNANPFMTLDAALQQKQNAALREALRHRDVTLAGAGPRRKTAVETLAGAGISEQKCS